MNVLSAILRFICGFALIGASFATYHRINGRVVAGEPIQIVGVTIGASSRELSWALGVVGLIGVLLIIFGVITLMKKRA
jgi:hypothetical protein